MKNSFKKTAEKFQESFETRHRPQGSGNGDGPAFYCLADDAPQWMKDAIFAAHDNGDRMPCDYIYDVAQDAVSFIAENCDGEDDDDKTHEFSDGAVSVYNHDRAAWLADHAGNAEYVDDAVEEGLADITGGIFALIGAGMYRQIEEIYSAIYSAIEDESDDYDESKFVAGFHMPGHMPDMDSAEFDSLDSAKDYIIDALKSLEDDHGTAANDARGTGALEEFERLEGLAEDYGHAAEDVNLKSSPFSILVGGYVFWIKDKG